MESRKKRRQVKDYDNNIRKAKSKGKITCLILFILMIAIYYQVYGLFKYTTGKTVTEGQIALYKWMSSIVHSSKVAEKSSLNIGIIGNITINDKITRAYTQDGIAQLGSIIKNVSFSDYDYTIASLNTQIIEDNDISVEYSAPKNFLKELNVIGLNLLVTSTRNLSELNKSDIKETLDSIKENNMDYVGTRLDKKDNTYYILEKNNIKVAILSYVGEDYCDDDNIFSVYSEEQLKKDLKDVKSKNVDCIILFIDTLRSNKSQVNVDKKELLQNILDKGVDVIISNDSIIQDSYENITDISGNEKHGYIKYSLGDFIGDQEQEDSDISKCLKVSINKEANGEKAGVEIDIVEDKTFVALSNASKDKYKVVDLDKELSRYKNNSTSSITQVEYNYLTNIKEKLE